LLRSSQHQLAPQLPLKAAFCGRVCVLDDRSVSIINVYSAGNLLQALASAGACKDPVASTRERSDLGADEVCDQVITPVRAQLIADLGPRLRVSAERSDLGF
jgi:hypothetical protein